MTTSEPLRNNQHELWKSKEQHYAYVDSAG